MIDFQNKKVFKLSKAKDSLDLSILFPHPKIVVKNNNRMDSPKIFLYIAIHSSLLPNWK